MTARRPASTCPARRSGRSSAALGITLLFLGLVFGGWLLAVGVFALVLGLIGWLSDARKEYLKTVEADRTGHLENPPAPEPAVALFATLVGAGGRRRDPAVGRPHGGLGQRRDPRLVGTPGSGAPPPVAPPPGVGRARRPGREPSGARRRSRGRRDRRGEGHRVRPGDAGPARPTSRSSSPSTTRTPASRTTSRSRIRAVPRSSTGDIFNGVETRVYDVPALPAGELHVRLFRSPEHDRDGNAPVARRPHAAAADPARPARRGASPPWRHPVRPVRIGRRRERAAVGSAGAGDRRDDARRRDVRPGGAARPPGAWSTSGVRRACRAATSSRCSPPSWPSTRPTGSPSSAC